MNLQVILTNWFRYRVIDWYNKREKKNIKINTLQIKDAS